MTMSADTTPHYELTDDDVAEARLVVVDDEPLITQTLSNFLFIELEIDAVTFNDPRQAAAYLDENPVDLVMSDFLMPQMDGIKLLGHARKAHPHAPRVLLTGYADKENAIKAINEVQLYQYVEKPWDNAMLKNIIRNGLERTFLIRHLTKFVDQLAETESNLSSLKRGLARAFA